MLVSKFKIEVKDEPEFAAETFEEKKARILRGRQGLTLTYVSTYYAVAARATLNINSAALCICL